MKKKVMVYLDVLFYIVIAIVLGLFIVTCIKAQPNTLILVIVSVLSMLKMVNFESDKKGYYVLIGLNVVIQSGVIIYGSFSDNVAIVFVIFACNIYALAKRKSVKRFMTEWYAYIILCEVVGILEAIGLIHIKSGVCSVLVEGMIVDIVFIVTSVFMVIVSNRRTEKYASLINIIFLVIGSMFVLVGMMRLEIQRINYKMDEIDITQIEEGRCVIESELLKGQVITRKSSENSENSFIVKQNNNSDDQVFTFRKDDRGVYVFWIDEKLDLVMKASDNGVYMGKADGGRSEEWILISQDDGGYSIASLYNTLRLDYDLMEQGPEITLILYEENGNLSQCFRLNVLNDNRLLNEYITEIKGLSLVQVFKSFILCMQGVIVLIVLDAIVGEKIRTALK